MPHRSRLLLCLLPLALGLGMSAALNPSGLGVIVILVGGLGLSVFCLRQPARALTLGFCCVMLAETKFRMRSPGALLAGDVDSQILFELALYGFVALIVFSNRYTGHWQPGKMSPSEMLLGAYVCLALLSALWASETRLTAVRGVQLALLYALGYVSVRVLGPQGMLRTCTAAVVGYVLLFALLAVIFPWANGTRMTQSTHIARFTWFALHPISAAAYAATAVLFLATEALFAPGAWRRRCLGLPLYVPGLLLLLVLLATRSRGALLACLLSLTGLSLRRYVHPWLLRGASYGLLVCAAISVGLGVSIAAVPGQAGGASTPLLAFLLRGQELEELLSLTGRVELWQSVYTLFLERPFAGYGYVASRVLLIEVLPWAGEAHNALAESLLNLGVLGTLLLWLPCLSALGRSFWHMPRTAGAAQWPQATICGMLLFLLLHGLVDAGFAGAPGYQGLLLYSLVCAQAQQPRWAGITARTPPSWPGASRRATLAPLSPEAWWKRSATERQRTV